MKKESTKNYILFWLSQAVSELGSMMTSYALIIWVYQKYGSVMQVSLLTFFTFAPKTLVSIFAGNFVDKHDKKKIIMITDSCSAICSFFICVLMYRHQMNLMYIYLINFALGVFEALQSPASSVAFGIIVPKEKYEKMCGLSSVSENLTTVLYPMLASSLMGFLGIPAVLVFDIATFFFAVSIMLFFITIPNRIEEEKKKDGMLYGFKEGIRYLKEKKGILYIIIYMVLLNFLSRLSYENILSAMILARSNNNEYVLGIVTSLIGAAGIAGGLIVSIVKMPRNKVKMLFYSAAVSFLFGDLLMALGRNVYVWSIAGIAASLPIPFVSAAHYVLIYSNVKEEIQGRVFAVRNAMKFVAIPLGILLGGALSQYVFEPMLQKRTGLARMLIYVLGNAEGTGMAVMFLCTGVTGFTICMLFANSKMIQILNPEV
ncbi:MFS transporter [[Clostridium] polysaccharolyticum]|uniref:Transmembrane secretion effector n=1 Tax=[Clostridium] polysaccharolyticum TaxID=29364 RepID=A0A1I0FKU7_9FIRM|nr:MFS transporter [[Clostridium] polysaccharolyticum]SET58191.1 Transmembrane secretion effector [[Clostridium] polysaccharolyticum]